MRDLLTILWDVVRSVVFSICLLLFMIGILAGMAMLVEWLGVVK